MSPSLAAATPNDGTDNPDVYERVAQRALELREEQGVPSGAKTPQHIVDQVVEFEQYRLETRDSGDNYGINPGLNERRVCATNPIDCLRAKSAIQDAERLSVERFPGETGDNIQDADRHCIWQALTTIRSNADFARQIGDAHEIDHPGTPESEKMDQSNNQIGRDVGLRHENDEDGAINECHAKAENGELTVIS